MEGPFGAILEWIILKEVMLSFSWSCLGSMSALLSLLMPFLV